MSLLCTVCEIYSQVLVENRRYNLPHLYLAPPLGVIRLEFRRRRAVYTRLLFGVFSGSRWQPTSRRSCPPKRSFVCLSPESVDFSAATISSSQG